MQQNPANPLAIAQTVLNPRTIADIKLGGYSSRGFQILDRWALNSPEELKKLEAQGKIAFDLKLYGQQQMEAKALSSPKAQEMMKNGLSDWEILQLLEIQTELKITG